MRINNENRYFTKSVAFLLAVVMVISMLPVSMFSIFADEPDATNTVELTIGETATQHLTVADAVAAARAAEATDYTISLLADASTQGFTVGDENKDAKENVTLKLNGKTLTVVSPVASADGISVIYGNTLTVMGADSDDNKGTIVFSNAEEEAEQKIKNGIVNLGTLTLDSAKLVSGNQTVNAVKNSGTATVVDCEIADADTANFEAAVVNLVNTLAPNATYTVLNLEGDSTVGTILSDRRAGEGSNIDGHINVNIKAGTYGPVAENGTGDALVNVNYSITGGVYNVYSAEEFEYAVKIAGANTADAVNIVIKIMADSSELTVNGFAVGNSAGDKPLSYTLDLNGHTLQIVEPVGNGTKDSGIRVYPNSKLILKNGTVIPSNPAITNVILNQSELTLNNVTVNSDVNVASAVMNRGKLVLAGETTIGKGSTASVYNNVDGSVTQIICDSEDVKADKILIEKNMVDFDNAKIIVSITKGSFTSIETVNNGNVQVEYTYAPGFTVSVPGDELQAAIDAVSEYDDEKPFTIVVTKGAECGLNIGSDSSDNKNIVIDLNGETLTLKDNGIRILNNKKVTIKNGTINTAGLDTSILNYGTLTLDNVKIVNPEGKNPNHTIKNLGTLNLTGNTEVADGKTASITLGVEGEKDAVLNCASESVKAGKVLADRNSEDTTDTGSIVINISNGSFGAIDENKSAVAVTYNITGGVINVANKTELSDVLKLINGDSVPTIKFADNIDMSGLEIDKKVVFDLGGNTYTIGLAVGPEGARFNGIRVLDNGDLTVKNGKIAVEDYEETYEDRIVKNVIANFGTVTLDGVTVEAGDKTVNTIYNRGTLTLTGKTVIGESDNDDFVASITVAPTDKELAKRNDAKLIVPENTEVETGKILLVCSGDEVENGSKILLRLKSGVFGKITTDGKEAVAVDGQIIGGTYVNNVNEYCLPGYECVSGEEDKYIIKAYEGHGFVLTATGDITLNQDRTVETVYEGIKATVKSGQKITFALKNSEGEYVTEIPDLASIDPETGVIKAYRMGTVTVVASCAKIERDLDGNGEMTTLIEAESKSTEVKILGAPRELTLTAETYELYTGELFNAENAPKLASISHKNEVEGEEYKTVLTYSIDANEDNVISDINPETGEITFNEVPGTATVKVTLADDGYYAETSATYKINVTDWVPEGAVYNVTGEKLNSDSEWFTADVSIEPLEGYKIAYPLAEGEFIYNWQDKLENVVADGVNVVKFYIKNPEGKITSVYEETISRDTQAPYAVIKIDKHTGWEAILSVITFGAWKSDKVKIDLVERTDVNADDPDAEVSGFNAESVTYFVDVATEDYDPTTMFDAIENDETIAEKDKAKHDLLESLNEAGKFFAPDGEKDYITANTTSVVYARFYDNAGNVKYVSTNGIIYDNVAPTVSAVVGDPMIGFNAIYTDDVAVTVNVSDNESGIYTIVPVLTVDGNKIVLNEDEVVVEKINNTYFTEGDIEAGIKTKYEGISEDQYKRSDACKEGTFKVIVDEEYSGICQLTLIVTDYSGNVTEITTDEFEIDAVAPVINEFTYETGAAIADGYSQVRTATIIITERNFDAEKTEIIVKDSNGNAVEYTLVEDWTYVKESALNTTAYAATIRFKENKKYGEFTVVTKDTVGHEASKSEAGQIKDENGDVVESAPIFVVDNIPPAATLTAKIGDAVDPYTWNDLVEELTHAIFDDESINIGCEYDTNDLSPELSIQYFSTDSDKALSEDELKSEDIKWDTYSNETGVDANCNNIFTYYFKIIDAAGNVTYISTDGFILEDNAPIIDIKVNETDVIVDGFYTDKLNIVVDVTDPEIYSGLNKVEYQITCDGETVEEYSQTRYDFYKTLAEIKGMTVEEVKDAVIYSDLDPIFHHEFEFDSASYNGDVKFTVTAVDNSGNSNEYSIDIPVDTIAPVIDVEPYEFIAKIGAMKGYYSKFGTKVTITERNFDPENIKVTVKAVDVEGNPIVVKDTDGNVIEDPNIYNITSWASTYSAVNPNEVTHTAFIEYNYDANYSVYFEGKDLAGNDLVYVAGTTESEKLVKTATDEINGWAIADENGGHHGAFTIDNGEATGTVSVTGITTETENDTLWSKLFNTITFGLWSKETVTVKATRNDTISPVQSISYVESDIAGIEEGWLANDEWLSSADMEWKSFDDYNYAEDVTKASDFTTQNPTEFAKEIGPNTREVVYVRLIDFAGNVSYLNTNGIIVDNISATSEIYFPDDYVAYNENDDHFVNHPDLYKDENGVKLYNKDVYVRITATDELKSEENGYYKDSGLKTVKYWIVCDDVNITTIGAEGADENGKITIFNFENTNPAYNDLVHVFDSNNEEQFKGNIIIDADLKNDDGKFVNNGDVIVYVEVTDNAGNSETYKSEKIEIDTTKPVMTVEYKDVVSPDATKNGGFLQKRTAVIRITERKEHFVPENIIMNVNTYNGSDYSSYYQKFEETSFRILTEAVNSSEINVEYEAEVEFASGFSYSFTIEGTDLAGNPYSYDYEVEKAVLDKEEGKEYTYTSKDINSENHLDFTVDTVEPKATLVNDYKTEWQGIIDTLTFGVWTRANVGFSIKDVKDTANLSPILSTEYTVLTEAEAVAVLNETDNTKKYNMYKNMSWSDKNTNYFVVSRNKLDTYVVIAKVVDYAGNILYVYSNGYKVEDVKPVYSPVDEKISVIVRPSTTHGKDGFYTEDVVYKLKVSDLGIKDVSHDTVSGLKEVTYRIIADGVETKSETISFEYDPVVKDFEKDITIVAAQNNCNNVVIEVKAIDYAGNVGNAKSDSIKIDITKPTIDVVVTETKAPVHSYNNPTFFQVDREATITITEKNFNVDDVVFTHKIDGNTVPVNYISQFEKNDDTSGHDTEWVAKIRFDQNGTYDFDVEFTDRAGHQAEERNFKGTTPQKFEIDKKKPEVHIQFNDSRTVSNATYNEYISGTREVIITVTERNFDASLFKLTNDGRIPRWDPAGTNKYTAKVTFNTDGNYKFGYTLEDKAGNKADSYNPVSFVIDQKPPENISFTDHIKSTTLDDKGAYDGDINFEFIYSDINIDLKKVEFKLVERKSGEDYASGKISLSDPTESNGSVTVSLFDDSNGRKLDDGIYDLTLTVYDKAGNSLEFKKTLSANRDSSNFLLDTYIEELIEKRYTTKIEDAVIISEVNCDELVNTKITVVRDGVSEVLSEDKYKVTSTTLSGDWHEYTYTIDASVFAEDGNYTILIESEDAAGNMVSNLSAIEDYRKEIGFAVDDTKPTVIISGLDDGPYDAESIDMVLSFEDNIGAASIKIERYDGETLIDNEEFIISDKGLNSISDEYKAMIAEYEGEQTIKVTITDHAGNVSDEVVKKVTVSTSAWVRYINNDLYVGLTIAAVVIVAAAAIAIPLIAKKKKKTASDANTAK